MPSSNARGGTASHAALQAAVLGSARASCAADAQSREACRQLASSTAQLDDGNDRAILVQGDEGSAQVVRLGHRGTPSVTYSDEVAVLAARPIGCLGPANEEVGAFSLICWIREFSRFRFFGLSSAEVLSEIVR